MEDESRLLNDNKGTSTNASQGHRFGIRLDHEFNENTSILFEPQFNFGAGNYSERFDFSTRTARGVDTTFTNQGFNDNRGDNQNWSTSGRFLFRQRLGKAGRTFSANIDYNFSNNEMTGLNQSLTQTDFDQNGQFDNEIVNQRFDQLSKNSSLCSFTE